MIWLMRMICVKKFQLDTEDIVKEVENSIAEFKRQNQEYDEERVKDQVCTLLLNLLTVIWIFIFVLVGSSLHLCKHKITNITNQLQNEPCKG